MTWKDPATIRLAYAAMIALMTGLFLLSGRDFLTQSAPFFALGAAYGVLIYRVLSVSVRAQQAGKLRSICLSNFQPPDVQNILDACTIAPQVNQVLLHVGNTPDELLGYCAEKGSLVEAYSPIAHGEMLKDPDVVAMAERYSVTVPQLCIRYALQLGTVPLPKTANPEHMRSNAEVDFVISGPDMEALRGLRFSDYGTYSKFLVFSGK